MAHRGLKPELYWKPGDPRPHDDEEPKLDVFRKSVNKKFGYDFKDFWDLHKWSISETAQFYDYLWDYFHIIGEKGPGPAWVPGIPMNEPQKWFPGAKFNLAENLLLNHPSAMSKTKLAMVASVEPDPASSSPHEPVEIGRITYHDLYREVGRAVQALKQMGVKEGDSVVAFAATSVEVLIAFLATLAVGALFSSTPAEFGVKAVVDRYAIVKPKVLFTIDTYRYAGKHHSVTERAREVVKQLAELDGIEQVIVIGHLAKDREPVPSALQGYPSSVKVRTFNEFMKTGNNAPAQIPFWRGPFDHPAWIVFSSGTTGTPKSIYGPGAGIYFGRKIVFGLHWNMDHRDSFLQFSTMGWIVWNVHMMWLSQGGTVVAYDGSPFHPTEVLFRLVEKYRVSQLGASPRYIQTLAKKNFRPTEGRDISCLKQFYTTGAPVTLDVYDYFEKHLNKIFITNAAGGTELGGSELQSTPVLPIYKGELQAPILGMDVIAADPEGKPLIGEEGTMLFRVPFPNMPVYFVNDPGRKRYLDAYFSDYNDPPLFNMNDNIWVNPETKGTIILGRADGVLNPSGVRFGSSELYYILEKQFADVIEDSIAVGQRTPEGNERVILFIKTHEDKPLEAPVVKRIKDAIATGLSRRHVPEVVAQCPSVPVTASGKKLEPSLKKILNGSPLSKINSAGVLNPEVFPWYAKWYMANGQKRAKL